MNRIVQSIFGLCLLAPAAAAAAPAPGVDCLNPSRDPSVDYREYMAACAGGRAKSMALAAVGNGMVVDEATNLATAEVYLKDAPTWTDAQIQAEFTTTRDARYLYSVDNPSFSRRLSWLFPDDGCYARAEQVADLAEDANLPKPFKLFAFGPLNVTTSNSPNGSVSWWYHVVPVVKNTQGEAIVLDAAINPCGPLAWKDWLKTMVDDITVFDDTQNGNGITVADDAAYSPFSLTLDDPDGRGPSPTANELISLDDLQGGYLLTAEWNRQTTLGRDPAVWLGGSSPWLNGCTVPCTEATATDMGAQHSVTTVPADGCIKVSNYPGSWVGSVVVQAQANGNVYPVPYTWSSCSSTGTGTLTGDWTQGTMRPAKNTCTTVIDLKGSSSTPIKLKWWANG